MSSISSRFCALPVLTMAVVLTGCLSAPHAVAAPAGQANGGRTPVVSGGTVSIPVTDATLGMTAAVLLAPAGFHGTARIDRTSDGMANGQGTLSAVLTSANGKEQILLMSSPFRTYGVSREVAAAMPGNPLAQPNVALLRFTSTADLLRDHILKALGLSGVTSLRGSQDAQTRAKAREQMASQGMQGPISNAAVVSVTNGGRETVVIATTTGYFLGTSRESTSTLITLIKAPEGKPAADLAGAFIGLQQPPPSQQWRQADAQYNQMRIQQMNNKSQQDTAISNAQTQQIVATGQNNVRQMQQQGEARTSEWEKSQQRISDQSTQFQG